MPSKPFSTKYNSTMSNTKVQQRQASKDSSTVESVRKNGASGDAMGSQLKCIMIGIGLILVMNLALTCVALVLGLQIKSEVDTLQQELAPMMEMMESLEPMMQQLGAMGTSGGDMMPSLPQP